MRSINKLGYKDISPYKDSPYLDIHSPSGAITMKGVSTPLLAITDQGERRIMYPGEEHQFNSKLIREIPMRRYYQGGGEMMQEQQMPQGQPQQGGQPQPADIIAAYIELNGLGQKEAEQIYKSFYKMSPEDKQALLGNMMNELQEAQGGQDPNEQQEMQDPQMQQHEMMEGQHEMTMPDGQQAMMVGGVPIFSPHVYGYSKQYQAGGQYVYDDNFTQQNMNVELMNAMPNIQRREPVVPVQLLPNLKEVGQSRPSIVNLDKKQPTQSQLQELIKMMDQESAPVVLPSVQRVEGTHERIPINMTELRAEIEALKSGPTKDKPTPVSAPAAAKVEEAKAKVSGKPTGFRGNPAMQKLQKQLFEEGLLKAEGNMVKDSKGKWVFDGIAGKRTLAAIKASTAMSKNKQTSPTTVNPTPSKNGRTDENKDGYRLLPDPNIAFDRSEYRDQFWSNPDWLNTAKDYGVDPVDFYMSGYSVNPGRMKKRNENNVIIEDANNKAYNDNLIKTTKQPNRKEFISDLKTANSNSSQMSRALNAGKLSAGVLAPTGLKDGKHTVMFDKSTNTLVNYDPIAKTYTAANPRLIKDYYTSFKKK